MFILLLLLIINIVSSERPLFLHEVLNKSYSAGPYFFGKCFADLPLGIIICSIYVFNLIFSIGIES